MRNKKENLKEPILRKLARSRKWQTLYRQAKDLSNIKLFENDSNFTPIQIMFLNLLKVYESLYTDLALKEDFISEEVIENWLRCDAYLYYRRVKKKKKKNKDNNPILDSSSSLPKIRFTKG